RVDAVCHQAARVGLGLNLADAPDYAGCNDLGTAVVLAAMARARVNRLVLASSMVVYGEGAYACAEHGPAATPPPRRASDLDAGRFEPRCERCGKPLTPELVPEEAPFGPRNVYAATKLAQEHFAGSWARAADGQAVALRYHNVYGPGMPRDTPYAGVASFFRSSLEAGRAPRVFEDGRQLRDFVHVRDVAGATVAAIEAVGGPAVPGGPGALRAYNVGSGTPRTVGQLASALAAAYGGPSPVVTGEYRLGDVRHITASSERITRELGWRAGVPFTRGVAEFASVPAGRAPAGRAPAGSGPAGRVPA
ncbi:MAG: NAD-dependent epimerase/dehydratase family protein, partial [Trebonia sp.]